MNTFTFIGRWIDDRQKTPVIEVVIRAEDEIKARHLFQALIHQEAENFLEFRELPPHL